MKSVLVVGGGVAGLVAGCTVAAAGGHRVDVLEAQDVAGGKAASWRDASGLLVEAGLHVCFPHYRHFLGEMTRLGAMSSVLWDKPSLSYVAPGGHVAHLRFPRLPPPLNGAVAIARHRQLSALERMSALAGATEATLSTAAWRHRYESVSFTDWARRRGLSRGLRDKVLEPLVRGLTFLDSDRVSARAMLDYIHAVGRRTAHFRVGLFRDGSGPSIIEPLVADLRRHGGELHLAARVRTPLLRDGRVRGVQMIDGSTRSADAVILAVPAHALQELLPCQLGEHPVLQRAMRLRCVPVASVIVQFDRRVGGPAGVRLSAGCVFNTWIDQTDVLRELAGSRRSVLQFVVAPLDDESLLDDGELASRVIADVRRLLPSACEARVERTCVTRTPLSFHAVVPGAEALRPGVEPGVPGLFLAGDYVRTGSNPNLESATCAGLAAARCALGASA